MSSHESRHAFFTFEWHSQNEVGNIDILIFRILWRDREKLYPEHGIILIFSSKCYTLIPHSEYNGVRWWLTDSSVTKPPLLVINPVADSGRVQRP